MRYLLTSALPYANGYLHLGHVAGAYLPGDMYARFLRLSGEEVLYVCGSDEHGVAITIAAEKEKVTPKQIIDKYHYDNMTSFHQLGMSFNTYQRTSIDRHHKLAREFFADFLKKGYLSAKEEEQFYDQKADMFLPDRYVEGTCPNCGAEHARGDQCDNCGAYYSQTELKDPISLVSGKKPILKKTKHWYFKFGDLQQFLENYIGLHSDEWKDNVVQQTKSWLKTGLSDRAITRDLKWGVKIDDIPGLEDEDVSSKRLYVWFDAVLGYISATQELFMDKPDEWRKWWQDDETNYVAFIGKDNIVFHTLIFPAMLHARKDKDNPYILPENVPAHEFLNLEGQKFSKSRNWSIDLRDFLAEHPDGEHIDSLRYTLAMNFPETKDSDFTWKDYQARVNNELAAIFGNFVNRSLTFLHKNFDGKVPELLGKYQYFNNEWRSYIDDLLDGKKDQNYQTLDENDEALILTLYKEIKEADKNYRKYRFRDAVVNTMNAARAANKYFNDQEPWKAIKDDKEKAAKTLYTCVQVVRTLSIVLSPILPYTCKYVQELLGVEIQTGFSDDKAVKGADHWSESYYPILNSGKEIQKPTILFTRVEDSFVEKQIEKLGEKGKPIVSDKKENKKENDGLISIDDFFKVKLRTALILEAERIPKSDKLIKLQVDLGSDKRQIIAGIGKNYEADDLPGKTVVVVANLKAAKLMGEKSEGMLLAANTDDGKVQLVEFEDIDPGQEVR
mgnify:FL=1